ncbi:MAG: hypothetical protein AAGA93_23980 [Actinomycetota bacterium]
MNEELDRSDESVGSEGSGDEWVRAVEAFDDLLISRIGHVYSARLADGTSVEGGLLDITVDGIELWQGGPLADERPIPVPRHQLDLDRFHVSTTNGLARRARWSAGAGHWLIDDGPEQPIDELDHPEALTLLIQHRNHFGPIEPTDGPRLVPWPATGRRTWWRWLLRGRS